MKFIFLCIGIILGAVITAGFLSNIPTSITQEPFPIIATEVRNLSLDNFSEVFIRIESPFIILDKPLNPACNLTLSAITDELQLTSIQRALTGEINFRPNPHELFADAVNHFNISVDMVRIDRLEGNAYLASLILRKDNHLLSLDSRPSDAIAIALRTGARTFIKNDIFEENAEQVCV